MLHIVASLIADARSAVASVETHLQAIGEKFRRLFNHQAVAPELRDALPSVEAVMQAHTGALARLTQAVAELHDAVVPGALAISVPRPPVLNPDLRVQLVNATQAAAVDETHAAAAPMPLMLKTVDAYPQTDYRAPAAAPADAAPSSTEPAAS